MLNNQMKRPLNITSHQGNVSYVNTYPLERLKLKTLRIPSTDKDLEPLEFSYIAGGNAKRIATL